MVIQFFNFLRTARCVYFSPIVLSEFKGLSPATAVPSSQYCLKLYHALLKQVRKWGLACSRSPSVYHKQDWNPGLLILGQKCLLCAGLPPLVALLRDTNSPLHRRCFFTRCFALWKHKYGLSQVVLVVKNLPANAGDPKDTGLIPMLRTSPRTGNDNPF